MFIGQTPAIALSDLIRDVKNSSTNFINENRWVLGRFRWQEGFGAFSYSHSQIGTVVRYVNNQERHHARKTFRDEYLDFLKKFDVPYDERFIFRPSE